MVIRVDFESFRLLCPDAGDVFVWREAPQCLEPSGMVVCIEEELEMLP